MQKERRHEYETVWVDGEGNELEEPPDDAPAPARGDEQPRREEAAAEAPAAALVPRDAHAAPAVMAARGEARALLGVVIFVLFAILDSKGGKQRLRLGAPPRGRSTRRSSSRSRTTSTASPTAAGSARRPSSRKKR